MIALNLVLAIVIQNALRNVLMIVHNLAQMIAMQDVRAAVKIIALVHVCKTVQEPVKAHA